MIQLLPSLSANELTLASIAAVLLIAVPSWHFLEKPVLRLKGRAEKREPMPAGAPQM